MLGDTIMNRVFLVLFIIVFFMTALSFSFSNVRGETTSNSCTSSLAKEQKTKQYQEKIRNSYEIAQSIEKLIPYAIIITLVIAIFLIALYFHGNKQDMLRFIYGTDNLAAISLTVFGSFSILELLAAFALGGLPSSSDILPLMIYYITSWKTWVFVIGSIGLQTRKQRLSTDRKSKGYQMPIWLILIGVIWIVDVATDVLPSLLKWGTPPGTVTICIRPTPVDSLPLSEIGAYFVAEPSFILIAVGVSLIFLKWIISAIYRVFRG